jgi:hypothetical protein
VRTHDAHLYLTGGAPETRCDMGGIYIVHHLSITYYVIYIMYLLKEFLDVNLKICLDIIETHKTHDL